MSSWTVWPWAREVPSMVLIIRDHIPTCVSQYGLTRTQAVTRGRYARRCGGMTVTFRWRPRLKLTIPLHSPVDVAPVSDFHDSDGRLGIVNRIENPIVPLAHTVFVLARQFFTAIRSWLPCESPNPGHQPLTVFQLDCLKFFDSGWFDLQSIVRHGSSDPSAHPRSRGLAL